MATHHSSLDWRIPWTGEPVRGVEKNQTWLKQLSMHLQASVCEQQGGKEVASEHLTAPSSPAPGLWV